MAAPSQPNASPGDPPDGHDIRALYERYGRAVYQRCHYFLRNEADAQDALHDVFLKLVQRHDAFRGEASPLTWIVRITTNHCLNILRSRRAGWRRRYETAVRTDRIAGAPSASEQWERHELVRTILPKIERKLQLAAIYYFVDEMTQDDAARAAGCSVPTLRKRLRRFIALARRELRRDDIDVVFGEAPV